MTPRYPINLGDSVVKKKDGQLEKIYTFPVVLVFEQVLGQADNEEQLEKIYKTLVRELKNTRRRKGRQLGKQ